MNSCSVAQGIRHEYEGENDVSRLVDRDGNCSNNESNGLKCFMNKPLFRDSFKNCSLWIGQRNDYSVK